MRLRVLGTLELVGADSPLSPKLRRLLASLLVRSGSVVSVDWLADVVWGDEQPGNAEAALHNLVSRLRTSLRTSGGPDGTVLLTRAPGYLLQVAPDDLDATRFERLASAGRGALEAAPQGAAELLDEGLALWRGPAYAEYADEDFARAEAARLAEAGTAAREDRVDAALALGRPEEAARLLEPLVAEHPLRERPHAQLLLALYRAGRQADALAAHRHYRRRLDDELGLDPSGELRELEARILRHDPALRGTPDVRSAAVLAAPRPRSSPESLPEPRGNLPPVPPELLGRESAVAAAASLLASVRVLTLTGAGGIGKTALALRAAADAAAGEDRFPDGAWLVDLSAVREPTAVADAVATVLSVQQRHDVTTERRLVEFLRPRRLLLLLDSCEHVVDGVARLVDALRLGCPRVTMLATSREPLGLAGEQVDPVPPLALPPAGTADPEEISRAPSVALFVRRATAATPGFSLDPANATAVAEVCRRLDGVPLAIELAAARMRSMTPAEVVGRLADRFHLLRSARRISAERHRTLRAVVDWSYQLLDEEQRRVFDRLSVFAGGFSVAAAARVAGEAAGGAAGGEEDIAEVLAGLVDRSMVLAGDDGGTTRFTLLETMRAFGAERLAERGETDAVRRAHAECYTALAAEAAARLGGPDARRAADAIDRALDELRLAHAWALDHDCDLAVRLVGALADYAELRMPPEVFGWAERTLAAAPAPSPALPVVFTVAAGGARFRGELERAVALGKAGLAAADGIVGPTDPVRRYPLYLLCEAALLQGRLADVEPLAVAAERFSALAGDRLRATWARDNRALARAYGGDVAGAVATAEEATAGAVASGSPVALAWARYVEGEVALDADPGEALRLIEDALARARALGDHYLTGVALVSAASVRTRHGDPRQALPLFRDAVDLWHRADNWTQQWTTIRNVVELLLRLGEGAGAAVLLGAVTSRSASPLFGPDAERLARAHRDLTRALGSERFAALAAQGAVLDDADVVGRARALLVRAPGATGASGATGTGPTGATGTGPGRPAVAAPPVPPRRPVRVFGRDAEMARLLADLSTHRLVTLTGTGGVGKTRLALAAAGRLAAAGSATVVLDLAPLSDGDDVAVALAGVLGVGGGSPQPLLDAVTEYLGTRRLLLVVDNCEHLRPAVRTVLPAVLRGAGGVAVLATSREPLRLPDEQVLLLGPLPVPPVEAPVEAQRANPSVRLFLERAASVAPAVAATGEGVALAADICRRLDGLPLALELAAGRLGVLGPADLRDRLDDALDLLSAGGREERHATLRAVVDWSYDLLDEPERRLFERLSVFEGGFDLAAAERVAGAGAGDDPPDDLRRDGTATSLAALVEASLIAVTGGTGGRLRYTMLALLRRYAQERLAARGETGSVAQRHTAWVVDVAAAAQRGLETDAEATWARLVDAELPNIRAACQRAVSSGDAGSAARIVLALRSYVAWRWSGQVDIHRWARRLVAMPELAGTPYESAVFGVAAEGAVAQGDLELAVELAGAGMARGDRSPEGRQRCLYSLGLAALLRGDLADSERCWLAAADCEGISESDRVSHRANVALPRLYGGDVAGAAAAAAPFRRYADRTGWPSARAWARYLEGETVRVGAPTDARAVHLLEESARLAASVGSAFVAGLATTSLVSARIERGEVDAALDAYPEVLTSWVRAGAWLQVWAVLRQLAVLLAARGLDSPAAVILGAVDAAPAPPVSPGADAARLAELRAQLDERLGGSRRADAASHGASLPRAAVVEEALAALVRLREATGGQRPAVAAWAASARAPVPSA